MSTTTQDGKVISADLENRIHALLGDVLGLHRDDRSPSYNGCDKDPCSWCEEAARALKDIDCATPTTLEKTE